jgi:Zn-dependent protease
MVDYAQLILVTPILLFSLVFHEFAHAITSVRLGDPTPERQGRITLNPLAHLDPIGTLMIIFTLINGVGFGWAKPVQVDSGYYKNPARDGLLVALAGPLANLVLALFFAFMLRFVFLHNFVYFDRRFLDLLLLFLSMGFKLNISLAVFNLLPVPPLDGSKILCFYLKGKASAFYTGLENYGFLLLIFVIMIFSEPLSSLIVFIINHLLRLIVGI